jgi:hypothetical protein
VISWKDFAAAEPDLAAALRARFEAARHHVLATLRADGSPRVSGTEVMWFEGDLALGSMLAGRKAIDLQRDPRFALHAHTGDGTMADGDAKVAGVARELDEGATERYRAEREAPPEPFHLFLLDVHEATLTTIHPDGDRLVIDTWSSTAGRRQIDRY